MIAAKPPSSGVDFPSSDVPDSAAGVTPAGTLAGSTGVVAVGVDTGAGALATAVVSEAAGEDCWIAPLAETMPVAAVPAALDAAPPETGACVASALLDGLVEADAVGGALPVCAAGAGTTAAGVELAAATDADAGEEACATTPADAEAGADASPTPEAETAPFPKSTVGTVNTDPSFNRFRSCPMNAPGLASNSALDIFSLIARSCDPVISPAISLSDCPGFTAYVVAPASDPATAAEAGAPATSAALACAWASNGSDPSSTPATLAAISAARRARLDGRCLGTGRLARTIIEAPGEWTSYMGKPNAEDPARTRRNQQTSIGKTGMETASENKKRRARRDAF
jgi:hypothetical protein